MSKVQSPFFLVFTRYGAERIHKTDRFELKRGEKVVEVDFEFDSAIFGPPPSLRVRLEVESQSVADAEVVLDPSWRNSGWNRGDRAQNAVNMLTARLLEKALQSNDKTLRDEALGALMICKEAGVVLQIEVPEQEPEVEE